MPLGTDYTGQDCAIARSLEVVGERWTLLIVRDLFYGIRRYAELRRHIGLPSATLSQRLGHLIEEGVVTRVAGRGARDEYLLTPKGEALWPVICGLAQWGNDNYVAPDNRMMYLHAADQGMLGADGSCSVCGEIPTAGEVAVKKLSPSEGDPFAVALGRPHLLLEPLRA